MWDSFKISAKSVSLRRHLLVWILSAVALFALAETVIQYQHTLGSLSTAHDRLLRATAQSIGDSLHIESGKLQVSVPFALLEAYEVAGGSQMIYRVSDFNGNLLAGDTNLKRWDQPMVGGVLISQHDTFVQLNQQRQPVRMVVLRQPIEGSEGRGVAMIQVAETLELRNKIARDLLVSTLLRLFFMLLVIAMVIFSVVNKAVAPLRALKREISQRDENSLVPLEQRGTKETQPVIDALNYLLSHLQDARNQQQRLIADAAHQLRTPLAVLKTQLQSATSGDISAEQAVQDMEKTVDRATHVTNQLLSLAKVEQMRQLSVPKVISLDSVVRDAALELSPLMTKKRLDFELITEPVSILADSWLMGEMVRNLLSNAIRHTPHGKALQVSVFKQLDANKLVMADSGPGIDDALMSEVFHPFTATASGSGLGLTIAKSIADAVGAKITLRNRLVAGVVQGLDAEIIFPMHSPA